MQSQPPRMAARVLLFLVRVFWPILWLIGFLFKVMYKLFFSWWLNPTFDRWVKNSFAEEIRQAMPFLAEQHGGKVVPDPKPHVNDLNMDYVCLASGALLFKFARWRRENYAVQVAPIFAPTDLYDLLDVLRVTNPTANIRDHLLDTSWRHFGKLLEPRLSLIEKAFDAEHFQETKWKIAQLRRQSGTWV